MYKNYLLKKKYSFLFMLVILLSILIASYFISLDFTKNSYNNHPENLYVHYIDVGQGDSMLIQVNNKNLLIDAGPKSDKNKLLNYLSSLNIDKFDYIIATHPHEDHIIFIYMLFNL